MIYFLLRLFKRDIFYNDTQVYEDAMDCYKYSILGLDEIKVNILNDIIFQYQNNISELLWPKNEFQLFSTLYHNHELLAIMESAKVRWLSMYPRPHLTLMEITHRLEKSFQDSGAIHLNTGERDDLHEAYRFKIGFRKKRFQTYLSLNPLLTMIIILNLVGAK